MLCRLVGQKKSFRPWHFRKYHHPTHNNTTTNKQITNNRCCISRVDSGSILWNSWEWKTKTKKVSNVSAQVSSRLACLPANRAQSLLSHMIYETFSLNASLLITVSTISGHHFAPYGTFTPLRVKSPPLARWTRNPFKSTREKSRD